MSDKNSTAAGASLEPTNLNTDTNYKSATFIETYTGRAFYPLNPQVEGLSIIDIAHALSNQCRYSGHVKYFYSVAHHCILLAQWLEQHDGSPLDCLQILMHDAPEAYLVDMPRPVKQYMPQFRVWDHAINSVIREWLGWSDLAMLPIQDELDTRIIVDERLQLLSNSGNDWGAAHNALKPLGVQIMPATPEQVERMFLALYAKWTFAVSGKHEYVNHDWGIPVTISYETTSDDKKLLDLVEVDVRGNVGRVKLQEDEGIIRRDNMGGAFPRTKMEWRHGKYTVTG
jgi:hypothetical protein